MTEPIEVTTYFLEILSPTPTGCLPTPRQTEVISPILSPSRYKEIYQSIGEEWLWYDRSDLSADTIAGLVHAPNITIHQLTHQDEFAGFCELKKHSKEETQLLYFGLLRKFRGRGLGRYFLQWTIERVMASAAKRFWVHTCNLDHPIALSTYQKAGFSLYQQETSLVRIPMAALERQKKRQQRAP